MTDKEERVRNAVQALTNFVNSYSHDSKAFATELTYEHRTLQQSAFGLMLTCIDTWANLPENQYDGRNEYTIKTCRRIVEAFGEDWKYVRRPPLI